MLISSDEEEVFFDSVDCIQSLDSLSIEESERLNVDLVFDKSSYEVWKNEPASIQERRDLFLHKMGFSHFHSSQIDSHQEIKNDNSYCNSPEVLGLERMKDYSGAVSSSSASSISNRVEEAMVCCRSCSGDETTCRRMVGFLNPYKKLKQEDKGIEISKRKMKKWWKSIIHKMERERKCKSDMHVKNPERSNTNRIRVRHYKKKFKEFPSLYMGQEIRAHKGLIWTMKFSPDGRYLATGGEDSIIRIWRVTSIDVCCKYLNTGSSSKYNSNAKEGKFIFGRRTSNPSFFVIPEKVLKIEESPLQEFHGHTSDVLDLSWSNSNCLLSSSKDKTVRLWQLGSDGCVNIFHHGNYVTCIQFNPLDDGYFVSGSIDGKVRIWGVSERRVVDWDDVRDIITAICYRPDGQRIIVGTITGNCRFYDALGNHLQPGARIFIQGRKKSSGNRITSIQFSLQDIQRVMVTSADSKVRIFYGVDLIHKYRGLRKSGSQMSASFTSNGRHIISIGEDSRIYIWNYNDLSIPQSRKAKSVRSCDNFLLEGVSVAIPWPSITPLQSQFGCKKFQYFSGTLEQLNADLWGKDLRNVSIVGWFSIDGTSRGSATWPEEKLPVSVEEHDPHCLVIVTANWDGVIRIIHNYGLPVRL